MRAEQQPQAAALMDTMMSPTQDEHMSHVTCHVWTNTQQGSVHTRVLVSTDQTRVCVCVNDTTL